MWHFNHPFWHHGASRKMDKKSGDDSLGTQPGALSWWPRVPQGCRLLARHAQPSATSLSPARGAGSSATPRQHLSPAEPKPAEPASAEFSHFPLRLFSQFQLWLLYLLFLFLKTHLEMKPFITAYPQTVCGSIIDNESAAKMKMLF